jgi:succinoglycan biosynthesis protein ExoU
VTEAATAVGDLVTVVVPVRDDAALVGGAIRSLAVQDAGAPTIIVVDDGSRDQSADAAVVAYPGVVVMQSNGVGPAGARNIGIVAATTPFVAFCDADDTWPRARIAGDLAVLRAQPEADGVVGRTQFLADDARLLEPYRFDRDDQTASIPHLGALTVRRDVFARVGLFDPARLRFEDHEWFARAEDAGVTLVRVDALALRHRLRSDSLTGGAQPDPRARLQLLHDIVQDRRTRRSG